MLETCRSRNISIVKLDFDRKERRICYSCVGDEFLSAQIEHQGESAVCTYCHQDAKTFTLDDIAAEIEIAFEEHFYLTASEPSGMEYIAEKEGILDWDRKGDPVVDVIAEYAEVAPSAAEDIRAVLADRNFDFEAAKMGEENPFEKDACYAERDIQAWHPHANWVRFEDGLKKHARFFSRAAQDALSSIFQNFEGLKTSDGKPVIIEAGPGSNLTALYRARVFQSARSLEAALIAPDKEVGPPPYLLARAGRMNAHGISVFYGAKEKDVALTEVRPPVGSRVALARFDIVRSVRLLDLEKLRSLYVQGSVFDRDYIRRLERGEFLKWLSHRIAEPVLPDDEPFSYLSTQAIADYLATELAPPIDGIIYPSSQGGWASSNVVLFHKSSRVQQLDIPKDTHIHASMGHETDEGLEIDYWVWEEVPIQEVSPSKAAGEFWFESEPLDRPTDEIDEREPTLSLDTKSVEIHHVEAVTYKTDAYSVKRHRTQKSATPKF